MIDLFSENVYSLKEASKVIPGIRGGKKPHIASLYRWCKKGVNGVKLESIQVGGTLCTSLQAIQRFCNKLSEPEQAEIKGQAQQNATLNRREREIDKANKELEKQGM